MGDSNIRRVLGGGDENGGGTPENCRASASLASANKRQAERLPYNITAPNHATDLARPI